MGRDLALHALLISFALSDHLCRCDVSTSYDTEQSPRSATPPAPPQSSSGLQELLELLGDGELYPVLRREETTFGEELASAFAASAGDRGAGSDQATGAGGGRVRRDTAPKAAGGASGRVRTGDTILNIRGALRDAIGDERSPPSPAPRASRVDALVIRPSQRQLAAPPPLPQGPRRPNHRAGSGGDGVKRLVVAARTRVRLPCDLRNVSDLAWYKDGEPVPLRSGGEGGPRADGDALLVERATPGDAGTWRCVGTDTAGKRLTGVPVSLTLHEAVRGVWLAVDGRRLDAGNTWVPVHENTPLEVLCVAEGGQPAPELAWRVWPEPAPDRRLALRHHPTNHSTEGVRSSRVAVTAARELHNATLQCEATQPAPASAADESGEPEAATPPTTLVSGAKLQIHVTYPPSFVISRWPGFGVALRAGSPAALRCDVDANPPVRAWWQRDGHDPPSSPAPLEGEERVADGARQSATLRWRTLTAAHAGWYRCRAAWNHSHYSSIGYYLNVISSEDEVGRGEASDDGQEEGADQGSESTDEVERQTVDVPLGGSVQLHCPKGSVGCWSRRVASGAGGAEWTPAGSHHAHGVLGIKAALYEEGGEYRCVGARPPDLQRLRELKRVALHISGGAQATPVGAAAAAGGGWRLECTVCGRGVRARWLLPDRRWLPAALAPDLHQHCWRTALHVATPDEVWCTAQSAEGAGAVAVFPARGSPPPAQQSPRALAAAAASPHAARARCALLPLAWAAALVASVPRALY